MSPRYGLHADRYRRFRPSYPAWVFDKAVSACGEPHSLALELGAGSGQATLTATDSADVGIAGDGQVTLLTRTARVRSEISGNGRLSQVAPPPESPPPPHKG